jgi:hypothetical protein
MVDLVVITQHALRRGTALHKLHILRGSLIVWPIGHELTIRTGAAADLRRKKLRRKKLNLLSARVVTMPHDVAAGGFVNRAFAHHISGHVPMNGAVGEIIGAALGFLDELIDLREHFVDSLFQVVT